MTIKNKKQITLINKNTKTSIKLLYSRIVHFFKRRRLNLEIYLKYKFYGTLVNFFTLLFLSLVFTYLINQISFDIDFWLFKYIPIIKLLDPTGFVYSVIKLVFQVWIFCAYEYYGLYNYFLFYGIDNILTGFLLYYIDWVDYQYKHLLLPKK
jgi:hypothetical protein